MRHIPDQNLDRKRDTIEEDFETFNEGILILLRHQGKVHSIDLQNPPVIQDSLTKIDTCNFTGNFA
jgi:hypothetical protein